MPDGCSSLLSSLQEYSHCDCFFDRTRRSVKSREDMVRRPEMLSAARLTHLALRIQCLISTITVAFITPVPILNSLKYCRMPPDIQILVLTVSAFSLFSTENIFYYNKFHNSEFLIYRTYANLFDGLIVIKALRLSGTIVQKMKGNSISKFELVGPMAGIRHILPLEDNYSKSATVVASSLICRQRVLSDHECLIHSKIEVDFNLNSEWNYKFAFRTDRSDQNLFSLHTAEPKTVHIRLEKDFFIRVDSSLSTAISHLSDSHWHTVSIHSNLDELFFSIDGSENIPILSIPLYDSRVKTVEITLDGEVLLIDQTDVNENCEINQRRRLTSASSSPSFCSGCECKIMTGIFDNYPGTSCPHKDDEAYQFLRHPDHLSLFHIPNAIQISDDESANVQTALSFKSDSDTGLLLFGYWLDLASKGRFQVYYYGRRLTAVHCQNDEEDYCIGCFVERNEGNNIYSGAINGIVVGDITTSIIRYYSSNQLYIYIYIYIVRLTKMSSYRVFGFSRFWKGRLFPGIREIGGFGNDQWLRVAFYGVGNDFTLVVGKQVCVLKEINTANNISTAEIYSTPTIAQGDGLFVGGTYYEKKRAGLYHPIFEHKYFENTREKVPSLRGCIKDVYAKGKKVDLTVVYRNQMEETLLDTSDMNAYSIQIGCTRCDPSCPVNTRCRATSPIRQLSFKCDCSDVEQTTTDDGKCERRLDLINFDRMSSIYDRKHFSELPVPLTSDYVSMNPVVISLDTTKALLSKIWIKVKFPSMIHSRITLAEFNSHRDMLLRLEASFNLLFVLLHTHNVLKPSYSHLERLLLSDKRIHLITLERRTPLGTRHIAKKYDLYFKLISKIEKLTVIMLTKFFTTDFGISYDYDEHAFLHNPSNRLHQIYNLFLVRLHYLIRKPNVSSVGLLDTFLWEKTMPEIKSSPHGDITVFTPNSYEAQQLCEF
uniref:LAM_G_DOMAIN domain-containing protein n=1 Tax=Heterorhabditis bacteriophora TaxID=37862 RepID=A0A1I7WPR3_HETBA